MLRESDGWARSEDLSGYRTAMTARISLIILASGATGGVGCQGAMPESSENDSRASAGRAVPAICGPGDPKLTPRPVEANAPVWVFQGGRDATVRPERVLETVKALEAAGHPEVRFTVHEDLGHNVEFISPERANTLVPTFTPPDDCRILLIPRDGYVEPKSVAVAYAAAAIDRNAAIHKARRHVT